MDLQCLLTGEDLFCLSEVCHMGCAGLLSLVVLCARLTSFCSAFADFSQLIVVLNIEVHSLLPELCSLCSATNYCCLFVFFFLTGMEPDDTFDVLLVWMTIVHRSDIQQIKPVD